MGTYSSKSSGCCIKEFKEFENVELDETEKSKAAVKLQNQFRKIHSLAKLPQLIQEKVTDAYKNEYGIQVREIDIDTFNQKILPDVASTLTELKAFDVTAGEEQQQTDVYDVKGLEFLYPSGEVEFYKGQWDIAGKKSGVGIYIANDSSLYYGNYVNDSKKGRGILIKPEGDYYEGYFDNDVCHGKGILNIKNEYKYNGNWVNGKKEGAGVEFYHKDKSKYEGEFKDNQKEGKGKYTFGNGATYEGEFKNSLFHGQGVLEWKDGRRYEGEFENGNMTGKGVFKWKNGTEFRGTYYNMMKNGEGEFIWKNGRSIKGNWINNKLNGKVDIRNEKEEVLQSAIFRYGKLIQISNNLDNK